MGNDVELPYTTVVAPTSAQVEGDYPAFVLDRGRIRIAKQILIEQSSAVVEMSRCPDVASATSCFLLLPVSSATFRYLPLPAYIPLPSA